MTVDIGLTYKEVGELLGITSQAIGKIVRQYDIAIEHKNARTQILRPASVRRILELKGIKYEKISIGMHLVKGGVGKTTLVHAFGSRAAALGFRTLLIDLDQQANLSTSFGLHPVLGKDASILEIVNGVIGTRKITAKDAIKNVGPFLDIIPATMSLSGLDATIMVQQHNVETLLRKILKDVSRNYDLIMFDCPPALSLTTSAVHCFSLKGFEQQIVMPLAPEEFSKDGLVTTLLNFEHLEKKHGIKPTVSIVMNMMDLRTKLAIDLLKEMHREFPDLLHPNYIAVDQNVKNAFRAKVGIWAKPNKATEDMHSVICELLNADSWKEQWKNNTYMKSSPPSQSISAVRSDEVRK